MTDYLTLNQLLMIHLVATVFMTGLIWFVQLVHYPLMAHVGAAGFVDYEQRHMRRTTWIVLPIMLAELVTGIALLMQLDHQRALTVVGSVLLAVIWLSTFFLQVPCHKRLSKAFDAEVIRRLVFTNWIRTVAWTARCGVAVALLWNHR